MERDRHDYGPQYNPHPNPGWCFACVKTAYKLSPYETKTFWRCQRFNTVDDALKWRDGHVSSESYSETHSDFTVYNGSQYPQYAFSKWYFAWKREFNHNVEWK